MTTTVIIRFIKSPYPEHSIWHDVIGTFDVLHNYLASNQYPPYPKDSYRVVAEIVIPTGKRWSGRLFRRAGNNPLWKIVGYAIQRGFTVNYYFPPIEVQYSPTQVYVVDVKDGYHQEASR